mmetsp:Transcript_11998/g.16491  ORF Transcript_11998/g.16491 Transcript_11998/m.16491 type:complete len:85 (+) Transcript_11998:1124-1378(+)
MLDGEKSTSTSLPRSSLPELLSFTIRRDFVLATIDKLESIELSCDVDKIDCEVHLSGAPNRNPFISKVTNEIIRALRADFMVNG